MAAATQDAAFTVDPLLYRLPGFPSGISTAPGPSMSPCDPDGIAAWVKISGAAFPAMVSGGEPRVPIHLLLSRVLFTQGVSEIQAMIDDLNIHKSIATNEQAERLRKMDAEVSCTHDLSTLNLVTRSDAERICGIVRIESSPTPNEERIIDESERLSVQHAMFGTVNGWVYPSRKGGRSVKCQGCEYFFTPEDFVAHSHSDKKESQRTVHWGFDPSNWRFMLQLVEPSSNSVVCKEKWKEFIDEPSIQSCSTSEGCEGYLTNKTKRSFTYQPLEVPAKVARYNDAQGYPEKPLGDIPISDCSDLLKFYLRGSLNSLLGAKSSDSLALLGEVMQKETAFKLKSLTTINEQSSGAGQFISVIQPHAAVPHPSAFKMVGEATKQLQSNCDKLEELESILKQATGVNPAIATAIREIRTSLIEANMADYERLRTAYEFLFTMFWQLCDPLGSSDDPVMRTRVANLRADQITLGVAAQSSDYLRERAIADFAQQQTKLSSFNPFGTVQKVTMQPALQSSPASAQCDSHMLQQHLLMQQLMQLMQLMSTPQQTQ